LNVRDAALSMVQKNEELTAIVKIMGLTFGKVYEDVSSLRYGHLMIMADQDYDGSHIKGLIINFIHLFWPSLLRIPGFLLEFVTPIVRIQRNKEVVSFYSTAEFNTWKENNSMEGWTFKYYKGLGTSTAAEARQYFSALDTHRKEFVYEGAADDYAIDLAFSRSKAEERRTWMTEGKANTCLDESLKKIPFAEFINKELIQFSFADCKRCIPSIMDGLKPGQRKVLYACFKRNLRTSMRVAQLSGYVSETAFYHHGEASLQTTIVGMAQNYVGAHNINLLEPEGQFGTRLFGGKDSASCRYIYTKLSPLTRKLFPPADDSLVNYLTEDEARIEPEWYIPIIPMSLVNGTEGIGTGWSTSIPNFSPRDVVENVRRMMRKEPLQQMTPWYRGYKGNIEWSASKNSFVSNAVWRRVDDETLEITELAVHYWTSTYKEHLESLVSTGKVKVRRDWSLM
jgi:DNA topoisomerase-2